MKIVSRYNSSVLFEIDGETLKDADLRGADLWGANLRCANLQSANLRCANLQSANLRGAILRGADLRGANLQGADLQSANLRDADLQGADLRGADLQSANLRDADLRGARLPFGESWEEYLTQLVPALLTTTGKTVADIIPSWGCHSWDNCPMHVVFEINDPNKGPILLRPRIAEFVQFFDANLIPCPEVQQ